MLTQQNRVFDDLYEAERNKRRAAELGTQALLDLLRVIAGQLDGVRFEQMRKDDPTIPVNWSVGDWTQYFLSIHPQALKPDIGWGGEVLEGKATHLKDEQIAHLQAALARLQGQLDTAQGEI